jgi:DNA repair exonuclease SbcCD nuclease subunit
MQYLLVGDIHIGNNKDNDIFHNTCIRLFQEIVDTCVRRDIDTIIIVGDLFDSPTAISQKTLKTLHTILDLCKNLNLIIVRGNHDTYYKKEAHPNWLSLFKEYTNIITVEDNYYTIGDLCLVPWGYPIKDLPWSGYLLGHFEINYFKMNDSYECWNSKLNPEHFKKFKHVYSGHFHFPETKGNITYLGSPFQQDFGDAGSARGYYVFEPYSEELEFIEFTNSPKYYRIITNVLDDYLDNIKDNFIKLVFDQDYGTLKNTEIIEKVELLEPAALFIDISKTENLDTLTQEEDINIEMKSNTDILFEFMGQQELPDFLKRDILYKVVRNLIRQSTDEQQ